eukprot:TRINITY_DN5649_c0_g1_i6.p2 TRINITY_DN5649_c0_g1~~TRINITY_DN5649_c0_g1_i6.p2  ORF type:complete len:165 (+),score=43.45 TRINITY_DN5649_c0_g1_i6:150-644(+)
MASWDAQLEEYLTAPNYCCAAALAQAADATFYAAAPTAGEEGWTIVYKDPHDVKIAQDDGSEKDMKITEATQLKALIDTCKTPDGGVWFGGRKYTFTRFASDEQCGDDHTVFWAFGAAPKKGVHVVKAGSQIICGFFDEEKGQTSGISKVKVMEFAKYLLDEGY